MIRSLSRYQKPSSPGFGRFALGSTASDSMWRPSRCREAGSRVSAKASAITAASATERLIDRTMTIGQSKAVIALIARITVIPE